jgi:hypothetical protein
LSIDKGTLFRELAAYLREEGMSSCVLHGIDPESGAIGRDLDLYLPNPRQAFRAAVYFSQLLAQRGVRWVSLMHPIWGPRCIGIQDPGFSYCELHLITRVSMGCIDFGELFPVAGREGPHGFTFDPSLWFIKAVLQKYSSLFAHSRPVWTRVPRDSYTLAHKTEIENEFQRRFYNGAEFVSAALGPDTDANLLARRRGLYALLSNYCLAHPANAICSLTRWLHRRAIVLGSPTVPVMGIDTTMDSSMLGQSLVERLGQVFTEIVVADHPLSWPAQRRLQARQSLLVYRRDERGETPGLVDCWISIPAVDGSGIDGGAAAILDHLVQYNRRWSARYEAKALRSNSHDKQAFRTSASSQR